MERIFAKLALQFVVIGVILSCTEGISVCLSCQDVIAPAACNKVMTCGPHEECYSDAFTTPNGYIHFNLGCRDTRVCPGQTGMIDIGRRSIQRLTSNRNPLIKTRDQNNIFCSQCCHGDLCNHRLCGQKPFSSDMGPVCYACPKQWTQNSCDTIMHCYQHQVCQLSVGYDQNLQQTVYTTSCNGAQECEANKNMILQMASILGSSAGNHDLDCTVNCCNTPLCNNCFANVTAGSATTSITSTTRSTTTVPKSARTTITEVSKTTTTITKPSSTTATTTATTNISTTSLIPATIWTASSTVSTSRATTSTPVSKSTTPTTTSSSARHSLTCLHCTNIQSPRHCKHVTKCPSGEICHIHQTINQYGEVLFDLGCSETSTCLNRSHGNHACDECCNTDLCNSAGCGEPGYPSGRGHICYSCSAQTTEGSCNVIDFCGSNEVCMIREESEFGDKVYTSQCAVASQCQNHMSEASQMLGRSILEDETRSITKTSCQQCCNSDLCNENCSTMDDCASNPCVHGQCVNGLTGYTCTCDPFFKGQHCSELTGQDCKELRRLTNVSGVYSVRPAELFQNVKVYCDMETDGGGWSLFQRRVNGSLDFYQNFASYENGFGDVHGEHWLGLKYIHAMTSNAQSELRIDLMAADGSRAYEVFQNFRLSAARNYTLHIDSGHGTAGDGIYGLSYHNGNTFSTFDKDNYFNCAGTYHGGWWYNNCASVTLNGQYITPGYIAPVTGINYYQFKKYVSLKTTKMMFRRI